MLRLPLRGQRPTYMHSLHELIDHLDAELDIDAFEDYGPNGLQVPGRERVRAVVTGVSAQAELFERAAELGTDLVLVHHGLLWNAAPRRIDPTFKRRLKLLFDHDMSLAAYHLPLDAHPEVGNNALIADALGATDQRPFAQHRGRPLGVAARFEGDGIAPLELFARVEKITERAPLTFAAGPARIRSIGIVSGGGAAHIQDAIQQGLDAFLTGEPTERVMADAREGGVHFVAAGHYATETFGVRRLGELLVQRFGVRHEFVDIPNPI
jgi:dinuclear metal center YbgI/SA1388 family protein